MTNENGVIDVVDVQDDDKLLTWLSRAIAELVRLRTLDPRCIMPNLLHQNPEFDLWRTRMSRAARLWLESNRHQALPRQIR